MARKPVYDTADKLQTAIDRYITDCKSGGKYPLYADMLLSLGISRDTWDTYRDPVPAKTDTPEQLIERSRISQTIKNAELELSRTVESGMMSADPKRLSAFIFLAKQRAYGGYSDQQVDALKGGISIHIDGCGTDAGK